MFFIAQSTDGYFLGRKWWVVTLETNMFAENGSLECEFPFGTAYFQRRTVSFMECRLGWWFLLLIFGEWLPNYHGMYQASFGEHVWNLCQVSSQQISVKSTYSFRKRTEIWWVVIFSTSISLAITSFSQRLLYFILWWTNGWLVYYPRTPVWKGFVLGICLENGLTTSQPPISRWEDTKSFVGEKTSFGGSR